MKAREEKGELAAKVAELQARLKDAEEAVQPAPSPKVMRTICFSKFNLQKFVTLSLTVNFNRYQNRVESIRQNPSSSSVALFGLCEPFLMPGACRRRQSAGFDQGKHISSRR